MKANEKLRMALANGVVALVFLLGAGAAQATTVINLGETAFRILNLEVTGFSQPFNVEFVFDNANSVYDTPPVFDFASESDTAAAIDAVNAALVAEGGITGVGNADTRFYFIGFNEDGQFVEALSGFQRDSAPGEWERFATVQRDLSSASRPWAVFTVVPEPGTALLMSLGLAGLTIVGRSRKEESEGTA